MRLEWKPFMDGRGRVAVAGQPDGQVLMFFDGGHAGREGSYSCRMRASEARVLALAILGQLNSLLPRTDGLPPGRLCLTVAEGGSVLIGGDIEVNVFEVRRDTVKLTFAAPREVGIYRPKALARMQAEFAASAIEAVPMPATIKEVS